MLNVTACGPPPVVEVNQQPALTINNVYGIFRAVQSGIGIAALPAFMAGPGSQLVRVLDHMEPPMAEVYFVYPEELRHSQRINVFRDFLLQKIMSSYMCRYAYT